MQESEGSAADQWNFPHPIPEVTHGVGVAHQDEAGVDEPCREATGFMRLAHENEVWSSL